ncbi:MAG: AraC family transcriptional regulator [Lachnospiraceae bacterium]|nr:AraC family transcriptional regulator [Lachnospiraceae bacterium]
MADIREDGSEIFHYDIPDFPLSIKHNYIPANVVLTDLSIHWHEDIEITYVVSGSVYHQLNGKRVKISAGEAIYINSKQLHLIEPHDEDCELYCLIFHPMLLCASNYVSTKYVLPIVENENLDYFFLTDSNADHKEVLDAIIKIHSLEEDEAFELKTLKILNELWISLYGFLPKAEASGQYVNEDLHKVQKMLAKIHNCYYEELSLEDICSIGEIGKTKGTEIFCQYLNMTPVEYLICYRLEIASRMLIDTKDSVTDIALRTGFSDSSYFARAFKKRMGISPLKYRQERKIENE